jgi:hypothetical protein
MLRLELRLFRPSGRDEFLELARKDYYSRSSNRSHRQRNRRALDLLCGPGIESDSVNRRAAERTVAPGL